MNSRLESEALNRVRSIKDSLSQNNIFTSSAVKKEYNYEITASEGADKCKILVYFGKKGVKTVLQGNELSTLYKRVDSIVFNKLFNFKEEPETDEPDAYIGTDESGKGDIFGPLVIAAVYVDDTTIGKLSAMGVKDSKEIKNGTIKVLADKIKHIVGGNYVVMEIRPPEYNTMYEKYNNLNKLLNYAHSKVIEDLFKKVECRTVITDQFSKAELNISRDFQFQDKNFIQLPKGEKYIGVAAASILARDAFEEWFVEQNKLGFNLLKGASSQVEENAKYILSEFGTEKLLNLSKSHFKPIKNLLFGQ